MKNYVNYVLILVAAMALFASCGNKTRKPEVAAVTDKTTGNMFVMELSDSLIRYRRADTLDFGRVQEGQVVVRDFKVRNVGDRPMVITRIDVSCGCIETKFQKEPLKPGESGEMAVRLDTRGLGGWVYKTIFMNISGTGLQHMLIVIAEIE